MNQWTKKLKKTKVLITKPDSAAVKQRFRGLGALMNADSPVKIEMKEGTFTLHSCPPGMAGGWRFPKDLVWKESKKFQRHNKKYEKEWIPVSSLSQDPIV